MTRHLAFRRMSVALTLLLLIASACAASEQTATPDASASARRDSFAGADRSRGNRHGRADTAANASAANVEQSHFQLAGNDPPAGDPSQITCSGDIGPSDPVAIVSLKGTRRVAGLTVMRDYADPANPRTVCEFRSTEITQLIDARHVVIQYCEWRRMRLGGRGPSRGPLSLVRPADRRRYEWQFHRRFAQAG